MKPSNSKKGSESNPLLAAAITRAASRQTYLTIRLFVDRDRTADAFRAYAYFRWLDDQLDREKIDQLQRIAFVERQVELMDGCYRGEWPRQTSAEERMLVDLIRGDTEENSGLRAYIQNMMAVMVFDANRRGRLIGQEELAGYTRCLAVAVTEALHYFIGHGSPSPRGEARYIAVSGAHITHMLRDTLDDAAAGYFNVQREFLETHQSAPQDVSGEAYRAWVKSRVRLARACFAAGREALAQVQNLRCRISGHAYIARFEAVLDVIEQDDYRLRSEYLQCESPMIWIKMVWSVLRLALNPRQPASAPGIVPLKSPEGG
ncbi:MAG: squalene/phytoene synthase family protein [Chloroflexota bacterium]